MQGCEQHAACRVAQQLAETVGLSTASKGDVTALPDLVQQAVAAVTATQQTAERQLPLKDRLATCQLLDQLLPLPVAVSTVQQPPQQQPGTATNTQALFQQVLGQLPGVVLQLHQQAKANSSDSGSSSSSLVQLIHQQQPGVCLHLEALLHAAGEQLKAAVQEPAVAKWPDGLHWQLGQQLLQLSVTTMQQAVQQQLSLTGSIPGTTVQSLLSELVGALHAALTVAEAEDGVGAAGVAAVMSAAEQVFQLLQSAHQLGLLSEQSCKHVRKQLLQLLLPASILEGSTWRDMPCPELAIRPTAGQAVPALQQCHPQRLQVLAQLLQQDSTDWAELVGMLAADSDASSGWEHLLQLVLLVLQAVIDLQKAAADTAAAETSTAAAKQAAAQAAAEESESEPDYFHDIFGSEGADDESAAAAAADSPKAAVTYEQALAQLAKQLLGGLAVHLLEMSSGSSSSSSSGGAGGSSSGTCSPGSWGVREQGLLQLALCFVALRLPQSKQEPQSKQDHEQQQQDPEEKAEQQQQLAVLSCLAPVQQAVKAAVQQLCICQADAAQQLQQAVLLAPPPAGCARSTSLMPIVAQIMVQHAAAAAAASTAASASSAGASSTLLHAPWAHLATQLAGIVEAVASSNSSDSVAQLQQQLAWLLCPARLSIMLAMALGAPAEDRAVLAAIMLHCLERCSLALAAVKASTAQAGASVAEGQGTHATDVGSSGVSAVGAQAVALCAVHACQSALLWLLLPPALLPTAWLQQHLQTLLQADCAEADSSSPAAADGGVDAAAQLQGPWPAGLIWVSAMMQYKHETDELPVLLESLGVAPDVFNQEALSSLLPAFVPSSLPGMAAADNAAAVQEAVQHMQQPAVLAAALNMLQGAPGQHAAPAVSAGSVNSSSGVWRSLGSEAEAGAGSNAAQLILQQLLDSVLRAATAAWASRAEHNNSDVAAAVAYSCCHERALQLLLVLQQPQQGSQQQQGRTAATTATGFNMFGSYQHLVNLQQQLAGLLAGYEAALQESGSSSQLVLCQLSLQASALSDHPAGPTAIEQQPAVASVAEQLSSILAGALSDAVQRFQLCGTELSTPLLLKQQLHSCCAEVELLGQTMQAARVVLVPHLPKLLPLLSQLHWQVTNMQLRCLAAALSTCYTAPNSTSANDSTHSSSSGIAGRAAEAQSLQLLLALCTDADYAADAVDAVHEGLGYCLLASLSEPQGQCWPSRADPAAAVAAAATSAAEREACTSPVEYAAAQCVAGLMQPKVPAEQQAANQQMDWPLLVQQLNLLHGCLPAVPLPNFWAVGSLNRASGSIAAAGACLVACAAAAAAAADGQESSTDQQGSQEPAQQQDSASPVTAAVADWMHGMAELELQVPLLLRPLQLQHAHLLQAAVEWVASLKHSDSSPSTAPTAAARSTAEPRGVAAVLRDVSAALGAAVTDSAAAADADSLGPASAMAAAAVSRLRDVAEDAGSYHVPAMQDSSAGSVAAQLVQGLVDAAGQDGQHGKQQAGNVLQLLWQCVALEILDTSRVVELIQQVTGTFRGSDDVHAQQLHDSFLQQLRQSLLQLPQQYFDQLLLRQLSTKDAFASGASGVCRELWQLLLAAQGERSSSAVLLLQRLVSAVLQLTLGTQQAALPVQAGSESDSKDSKNSSGNSSSEVLSKKQLAAVSTLLGVVIQCATALGLPGVLACLNSLQALAAAAADWSSRPGCSSREVRQPGADTSVGDTLTERLMPFLPLLLFVQRVVAQTSAVSSSSSASGRTRTVRKSDSAISRSSRESGLGGAHSQASETDQPSSRSSSSAGDAQSTSAQPQPEQSESNLGPAGGSDASTVSVPGPFEAAAASLVLQDDAVQVLGGGTAAVPFDDEDDFLDEFEDEEEYLTQLLQHGALAAGASSGQPAGGPGAAVAAAGAPTGAVDGDGEGDESTSDEDESSSGDDDDYHDAQEGLPGAEASSDAEPLAGTGSSAAAATGAGAAAAAGAPAAAAAEAASAAAAAAAAAFGATLQAQPVGDAVDDDEQALLDEEFAALLQELLSAGAAPDVALAAVTAATGMAPPSAAVAVATEAAAASGDDEMVAVVEQLAAGAAAAAAAAAAGVGADGVQHAGTAATSPSASPSAPRQAGASGARDHEGAGASGASSASRRKRHRRSGSDSSSSYLPQLRRYWQRTRRDVAVSTPLGPASSSGNGADTLQCTFAVHGDQFVEQHWFQCYTCGLTDSRGCCSACVRICHAGHDVVYAAKSRFFCDCGGENGPRENAVTCKCLSAVPVGSSAAGAAAQGSSGSSNSTLMQQGWLLAPAGDPLARAGLAATLPDPLEAAWTFDPELYPDLYAAATGTNSSSNSSSKTGADGGGTPGKQQASAGAAEQLLYCGAAARTSEQQAAVLKLVPQGLVAKAARTLRLWLVAGAPSGDAGADGTDPAAALQQQQGPQQVLQGVASSALQLSQLVVRLLLQHSSMDRRVDSTAPPADATSADAAEPASQTDVAPPADVSPGVLPAVLQTKQLIMEGSSSSTKVLTKPAVESDGTPGDGSTGSNGAHQQQQQQPLVELQRVIRLGTMSSSSSRTRTRSSGEYGTDSSSSSSKGPDVPAEVAAALEGGLVCQQSAAAARQGQLLAVCRGESVGLMDGRLLAAELCGRDIFTKEEISAAVAVTSKALSPNQASSSSTANDASNSGGGAGASSYFYVRRHTARFHVLALHWDLLQGRRLLVVGYDQVQVWSVEPRDLTISDRLVLRLPAVTAADEAGRVVSAAAWLPDSDTWVAVTTPLRVYLFDLTHSASQPAVVIEPEGHVLLSGGVAFVPRLVAQQQQQQQQGGKDTVQPQLQQQLFVLLLTRDGQLLSAELPQQLLDGQQSCAAHWPHASCLAASNASSSSNAGSVAQGVSRSSSPGPAAAAAAASSSSRPSSRGEGRGRGTGGGADSSSSSAYGCVRLVAQTVSWPDSIPHLQTGRSCHWLQANSLLAVAGTGRPAAAAATGSADSSSSSGSSEQEQQQQQLLLQLDATCSNVIQCCRWDTAEAAAPVMGSPRPLVLSPAAVYWDLPLLPAARASYGAAQLFAVAPGQAKQLLNGTGSNTSNGQGCAYIAGLVSEELTSSSSSSSSSGGSGGWQAVVQPLHLRHSSAGAVVDGLAVLSFPYTQQLLLVVLCSKGNMYMYATKRPPGLHPMQPYTQLLRQQLTQGSSQQQQQQGVTGSAEAVQQEVPARPAAAAVGVGQQGLSRGAAAVAVATGAVPQPAAAAAATGARSGSGSGSGSGSSQQLIIPADASILLLQHCQNMTSQLSVSGDISRAGTAEAAARALFKTPTDPDRRVEGPTPGAGMKLVIKFASGSEVQPVGMKLLLPAAGAAPGSIKLTCGGSANSGSGGGAATDGSSSGRPNSIAAIAAAARSAARAAAGCAGSSNARTVQLAAAAAAATGSSGGGSARSSGRHQRWHQIIFTPDESAAAAAAGQITCEFSAAVDADRRVALCHMDLFGQPADVVAERAKQQDKQQEEEQMLSVDTCCTAAAAAVPATLMSGSAAYADGNAAATSQLVLNALLQTGAAAATAAAAASAPLTGPDVTATDRAAAACSSSDQWQQQVLPVVQQLLCPDAEAATVWSPSWQCEAAAHVLLETAVQGGGTTDPAARAAGAADGAEDASGVGSAGSSGTSTAALAVQDGWKLSYAVAVLQAFACTCTAAYGSTAAAAGHSLQLSDAAVFGYVHAMAQLQSVLQVRPDAVVYYLSQQSSSSGSSSSSSSSSSSNGGLAAAASSGLAAAVFTLKQLSSTALLPADMLAPLAKTAVELWMAHAAAERQQQQQQLPGQASSAQQQSVVVPEAVTSTAQGIVGLLLSSDPQLRLHTAAAWVQACSSSSSSSNASTRSAVFAAAAGLLLEQRQYPCSQMLAAYQAIADIAASFLQSAAAAAVGDCAQVVQSVGQVVQVAVQQLTALNLGGASGIAGEYSMPSDAAEMILLLQLLLAHVLSTAWQQQQQQQQQQSPADSSTLGSGTAKQPAKLHKQLLPQALLQHLTTTLLARLQYLVPLLQQQQQQFGGSPSGTAVQSNGVYFTVVPGEGAKQAGPGGYSNYQALLSPPAVVNTWGISTSLCQSLLGIAAATAAAPVGDTASGSSSGSSEGTMGLGGWLLDPYLQGGKTGTRLLQGLPLQLTAAAVDLAHTLLHYGLVQAVGRVTSAQLLTRVPPRPHQQQSAQLVTPARPTAAAAAATGSAWCGVLCHIMDMPALYPVRRLAKQVVVDVCGSPPVYKEVRSLHLLSKHTAALLQVLGLPQQQQQQQQQGANQGRDQGVQDAGVGTGTGVLGAAAAAVSVLQGSWQQQCAAVASLAQLLSVAESQPVGWAHICSSSSSSTGAGSEAVAVGSTVLPLLVHLVLECKVPQITLPAVKLINAALTGVIKASSSSSKGKMSSSNGQGGSSSGSKAPAVSIPVLDLAWLLPQQQQQQQQQGASTAAAAAIGLAPLFVFIDRCVVGWPETKERKEAAKTLVLLYRALGATGDRTAQSVLLQAVLQAVPSAGPLAGAASLQLYSAANQLLKLTGQTGEKDTAAAAAAAAAAAGDQALSRVVSSTAADLFATATAAAAALAVHPCGLAYQQLQELMELQQPGTSSSSSSSSTAVGYWLELSGCDVAGGSLARKPSSTPVRLDGIAAELKYGDRQVMARLSGWYCVHKLLLVVHSPRKSKTVADLCIWYCDSPVSDLQQLKQQGLPALPAAVNTAPAAAAAAGAGGGQQPVWRLAAADVSLSPGQTEVTVAFELPLVVSCLMVEFSEFHVSVNDLAAEVLHCPRCSHVVTDKHGLCGYCRENAYQCRQCRHINYEAPDAFICSECGHSRYGRIELLLQTVKAPGCPPLLAQANSDEALSLLDAAAATAASKATSLQSAAAAVQQQAAALAAAGFHHVPDAAAAAAAAAAGGGGSNKRDSSGGGSSSSTESVMRPGLRHLAELYTERCKPAFEDALQAARAHAAVRSAIAEAEAAGSSSSTGAAAVSASAGGRALTSISSSSSLSAALAAAAQDADAAAALFSSCSYGHISAVLCASVSLLRGALAAAPAEVTAAAQQYSVLPGLLALLQPHGSTYSGTSGASTSAQAGSSSSSSTFVADVRSLLLALSRADATLHDQLLQLLQQQLLPASITAADSYHTSSSSRGLSGHQLQLLLMIAQHDVQHMPKEPAAAAAAAATVTQQARPARLVLQLLQQAVAGRCTQGLWPDLLLLPGLKVMTAAAAVQQQWAKTAAAQAAQDAAEAAAAASAAAEAETAATAAAAAAAAAEAAKTEQAPAAAVDTGVEVTEAPSPAAAATAAAEEDLDVLDATVLSDAEAEAREQLKIAEYFSRKGSGSSGLPRSGHSGPPYMQQQRLQPRQRLQPMYGQSPFVPPPQQQQLQYAGPGDVLPATRSAGTKPVAAAGAAVNQQQQQQQQQQGSADADRATARQREHQEAASKAQAAAAVAAEKAAASAAAAADVPEVVPLQQLVLLAQQLLLHPYSIAVRKESAALLLQLQPDAVQRLRQLQLLVADACSALAGSTPGAAAVPGTELFALLMETVAELLVVNSKGRGGMTSSSTDSSGSQAGTQSAPQQQQGTAAATAADAVGGAHVSDAECRTALNGLLRVVCQQLVQQVSGLLQQEQQLCPDHRLSSAAAAAPARTAALPMLLEQVEQLLIGLAQLQLHYPQHPHPLSPRHRSHHAQQQHHQQGGHAGGWVDSVCLQQLLWALGGLDALTAGRTGASQSAAQQLHRLVKQGWLQGGDSTTAAAAARGGTGDGSFGESDILDEDEDYTEADEYETEVTNEEGMITNEEGELSEYADGDAAAAAAGQSQLLSSLPALTADVLAQRQAQLVEAIVNVLAAELQRFYQQQRQTLVSAQSAPTLASQATDQDTTAAAAADASAGGNLSWHSSLAVVSSLVALLTSAVSPEKPPPTYQLLLEKAATQEEFIPGQLPSGGLVTSAALAAAAGGAGGGGGEGAGGPLMRDVKNYICRRLDMTGLLDDDFGMELLIGGSLISLSLPVLDVIQHHWWPLYQQQGRHSARSAASSGAGSGSGSMPPPSVPMQVTFRLSGLDGEATEPQVKELNPGQAAGQNPDEDNVLAGVLARGQGTGLGLLLQLLLIAHQQPVRALRRVSGQLLQLLKAAVGQGECRQQLLQHGALGCLLHLVHLACKPLLGASSSSSSGSRKAAGADRSPAAAAAAVGALGCGITGAQLLLLLECLQELVTEANRLGQPFHLGAIGTSDSAPSPAPQQQQQQQQAASTEVEALAAAAASSSSSSSGSALAAQRVSSSSTEVAQLADGLSVLEAVGLGSCAAVLAKLLTALAHHSSTAQLGLIKHFAPALDLTALDNAAAADGGAVASAVAAGAGILQGEELGQSSAAAAAAAEASTAGFGVEGDEESLLLAAVHSESSGGPTSAQEHCLQLKAFLRLIEALSNTAASSSSSSDSAGSVAQQQQLGGGTTADFKQLVLEHGVPARLVSYLLAAFTAADSSSTASSAAAAVGGASPSGLLQPGSAAWVAAAARPGVPFALQLLTALAQGHAATASAVAAQHPSLLQLLHLLEGTAGGSTITPLAEACLEALSGAGAAGVASSISALRAATAAEMKARAAKKREALLASMGMVQIEAAAEAGGGIKILPSPGGVPALSPLAAELAALEGSADDDEGNVCMVCREGYALQPTTLLGCYCFCRVAAAAEWPGCSPPWGTPHDLLLSTVSHFNLIHVNCHAAAKAADASLRQPKREWQGATLRNGNVLCNSLLPLAAPVGGRAETAYAAAVMSFWQQQLSAPSSKEAAAAAGSGGGSGGGSDAAAVNVSVSLSRRSAALRDADNSLLRVSLVAADLAMLLWRFSAQLSFSEEARGGGRASNARLLFALLQLGRYYVVEAPTSELKQAQMLLASAASAGAALGLEAAPAAGAAGATGSSSGSGAASGSSSGSGSAAGSCSDSDMSELVRHAPFALALSLLCMGPSEWMAARRSMLALAARAGVSRAVQQAAAAGASAGGSSSHRRSSSGASPSAAVAPAAAAAGVSGMSDAALYEAAAPMLRLFGFVDWLHQWAKPAVGLAPAASSASSSGSSSSGWGGAMAQQLQDLKGCADAAGELLEVVDEAEGAFGMQDLLDGLGLLGVVLGPKSSSCEAFLRQAVEGL